MWRTNEELLPDAVTPSNNNNLCTKSLLNNLMESRRIGNASSSSLEQHSNSSSLESIESPAMDGIQALSTSCSEDSFEMSSNNSKPATDDLSRPQQCSLNPVSVLPNFSKLPEGELNSLDQKISEGNNSEQEQMSRDSLEPCSLSEKSNSLKKLKADSLTSASCQFDSFDRRSDIQELSGIVLDDTIQSGCFSSGKTGPSDSWPKRHGTPSTSQSVNSIPNIDVNAKNRASLRECIDRELDGLDTCLPNLDFNKLEEKLNCAAKERMMTERKLLGEQVRRRLALQVDQYTAGPAPRVYTRPSRSNLGFRLQTAMNLQVCYINDLKDEEDEDSSDDELFVPKSKSAPNLQSSVLDGSNLNATQLRQAVSAIKEKRQILEEETKLMLSKAKQAAKMQMEIEKLNTCRFTTTVPPKASRLQLSKMTCRQLIEMSKQLSKRIDEENAELMRLLVEKDSLYMQQDSMLVDIEDMIQHESNSESLNLPDFLKVQAASPMATSKSKFRILKR